MESAKQSGLRPVLAVEDLSKRFGFFTAVRDLSFQVFPGEVVGLLGRNGAGKTTSISCVSGLQVPDSGRIEILGVDALKYPSRAHQGFAVATQDIALYPGLSVWRNLAFFAALGGIRRQALNSAVSEITNTLALTDLLDKRVVTLSGGQQRLVHVGAALVQRPSMVLLDEPTSGLDVGARATVLRAIRAAARAGVGVLFSSHYMREAEDLCDRFLILEKGMTVAAGSLADCVARYGQAQVEVHVDGGVFSHKGSDVNAAIAALPPDQRQHIQSVRVVGESLEAVFLHVTGLGRAFEEDVEVTP